MKIKNIPAKSVSYGGTRSLTSVKAIVIHYTGNNGDTAENNGRYFATSNTRSAGAHFFVGQDGAVVQSIDMNRIAWAVGGTKYSNCAQTGGGKYYGTYTNANTVSIELCDNATKDPSDKQVKAVVQLVKYIRKSCPNAKKVIRHFDVTGKSCPARMCSDSAWNAFLSRIGEADVPTNSTYKVRVTADVLNVRKGPGVGYAVTTTVKSGEVYTIVDEKSGWGKLKSGAGWIKLSYTKKL